jgi:folate-binding Fe-S cluster repair protein YgfZ
MWENIEHQYRIIAGGAGWIASRSGSFLRFTGADALAFLHALVTADVAALSEGEGVYAAYLTPQGRMIADFEIYRRSDSVLVAVPAGQAAALASKLDALVFSEDVRITDASGDWAEIDFVGREAAALAARAVGASAEAIAGLDELAQAASSFDEETRRYRCSEPLSRPRRGRRSASGFARLVPSKCRPTS